MAASEQPNLELRSNLRSHESVVERIFSKSNFTEPSISLSSAESFQFVSAVLRQLHRRKSQITPLMSRLKFRRATQTDNLLYGKISLYNND